MATGPDPNRWQPTDPELSAREQARGGGPGDPRSTRMGASSWGISLLVVLVVAGLLAPMR